MLKKLSVLVLGMVAVIGLAACSDLGNNVSGYYVSVDINPSIEFVVDGQDNVESFVFLNEDAELLCADLDFTGMNVDEAVELFIQTATEAGYIDPEGDDNAVLITVLCEDGEEQRMNTLKERIRKSAVAHLAKNYINATVLTEDFTQEDLVAEAAELGVSAGKLKLAYAAMAADETLVLADLLETPVKDILAVVKELHEDTWAEYKDQTRAALVERKREMVQEHKDELDAYLEANPEMTDEEVAAYIEDHKEEFQTEAKEQWQTRVQQWKDNRSQYQNNTSESGQKSSTQE